MPVADLIFQRTIDLPPVIVWDALVDSDLLAGWLGEVRMLATEPHSFHLHCVFELLWPGADARQSTAGTVTAFEAPRLLTLETDNRGRIEYTLASIPGGLRETATELELRVDAGIEPAFASRVRSEWLTSLDRLERLLRGHPVDWANLDEGRMAPPGSAAPRVIR